MSKPHITILLGSPCSLLTVFLIALKLSGHITWGWLWILSPLWLPLATVFGLVAAGLALLFIFLIIIAVLGFL